MLKKIIENNKNVEINKDRIDKLKDLFPECFSKEGKLDITCLENEISKDVNIIKEGYSLNFLGKQYAKLLSSLETETVIEPDNKNNSKEENINSKNIYISGDNIDALKHLVKSYSNKIKCIYIDPPYNTGSDGFVYNDKFNFNIKDLSDKLDIGEEEATRIFEMTNKNTNSHSAWLTFMYPRLYIAKQLLKEDGVIFISIDDNEYANLKLLCDNIFGEENVECMIWHKVDNDSGKLKLTYRFRNEHEYIFAIYKNKDNIYFNKYLAERNYKNTYTNPDNDPRGPYKQGIISDTEEKSNKNSDRYFKVTTPSGRIVERQWRVNKDEFEKLDKDGRIYYGKDGNSIPSLKVFINEKGYITPISILDNLGTAKSAGIEIEELFGFKPFSYPKPVSLIEYLLGLVKLEENDIILDFFSGSATTANAVMNLNKKINYIMVQLQEPCKEDSLAFRNGYNTIDEIGQDRIRKAAKKIKEEKKSNIDFGFKHYTIKDIDLNTIDKLEKFEPNYLLSDENILDKFGKDTVLTTWMNEDGYGLNNNYAVIDIDGYKLYKCNNTMYLLNKQLTDNVIKKMLDMYQKNKEFNCDRVVLFGYSFTLLEIQTLKDNLKQLKNIKGINIDILTRY